MTWIPNATAAARQIHNHPESPARSRGTELAPESSMSKPATMIQLMTEADSTVQANAILQDLMKQEGCHGGRILWPAKGKRETHMVQTFHAAPDDAHMGMSLPDGMRIVCVPDSLREALGISK